MGIKIVILLFCIVPVSWAYVQNISFDESHDGTGNSIIFRRNIPDTSIYNLNNTKVVCYDGCWIGFSEKNYEGATFLFCFNADYCEDLTEFVPLSLRHLGADESSKDALSLYSEEGHGGIEILVDRSPFAAITTPIRSIGWTGKGMWTLYEGVNFDGPSRCLSEPNRYPDQPNGYDSLWNFQLGPEDPMTTIGSVIKGDCTEEGRRRGDMFGNTTLARAQKAHGSVGAA